MEALVASFGLCSTAGVVIVFVGLAFRLIFRKGPTAKRWGQILGSAFVTLLICLFVSSRTPEESKAEQDYSSTVAEKTTSTDPDPQEEIYITLDSVDDAFEEPPTTSKFIPVKIVKVLDAGTFDAEINGHLEKIRLDYVSIPELRQEKPDRYSKEAMEFSKEQIEGKTVHIEYLDIRDKFGRIVTPLWIILPIDENNPTTEEVASQMLNALLIREGCAKMIESGHKSLLVDWDAFEDLQANAKKAQKGIWRSEERVVLRETLLVGNRNSGVLHEASCSSVSRMKTSNKVMLTYSEAMNRGYRPCQRCTPRASSYQVDSDEEAFPVYGGKN